jgi:DNA-binding GntR family transcriptional regulator
MDIPVGYQAGGAGAKSDNEVVHTLTSFGRAAAGQEDCQLFGLKRGASVLRVERTTRKGEMSLGFGTLVVPAALAKGLTQRHFEHGRFFNTLVEHRLKIARYRLVIVEHHSARAGRDIGSTVGLAGHQPYPYWLRAQWTGHCTS